jgi:hypothetical protein
MKLQRSSSVLEKQLHAEVRRILQLLERTRRTRRRIGLLIALETGASRRKTGIDSGGMGHPVKYRPILFGPRIRRPGD